MLKFVLAGLATLATVSPALSHDDYQPSAQDLRDGRCTRQHVHIPAGKIVHAPPIVRCNATVPADRTNAQTLAVDATITTGATESTR